MYLAYKYHNARLHYSFLLYPKHKVLKEVTSDTNAGGSTPSMISNHWGTQDNFYDKSRLLSLNKMDDNSTDALQRRIFASKNKVPNQLKQHIPDAYKL